MSNIITIEESNEMSSLPLVGRVLMLNTTKAVRFQCYNFFVSRNHPIETVTKDANEDSIRVGLADGRLLDITDDAKNNNVTVSEVIGNIDSAINAGNIDKPVISDDDVSKILMGKDNKGNSYMIIPKDKEDYVRMQKELAENGYIRMKKPERAQFTGLSNITIEDLPEK